MRTESQNCEKEGSRKVRTKSTPQGLKPIHSIRRIGAAEAVPCYKAPTLVRASLLVRIAIIAVGVCAVVEGASAEADAKTKSLQESPVVMLRENGGMLENEHILAAWKVEDGRLVSLSTMGMPYRDKKPIYRRKNEIVSGCFDGLTPPFSIELSGNKTIPASALKIVGAARVEHMVANAAASRYAERRPGIAVHYALTDEAGRFAADWALVLRQGSRYIRQVLTIKAGAAPVPVSAVSLIDLKAKGIEETGNVKGSPLTAGNVFLGFESPLSQCSVQGDEGICKLESGVPIGAGHEESYSAVIGVAEPEQMRRSFLTYLERERAHPYRTFLHYNSWFDLGFHLPYTQAEALDRIHAIGEELNKKRGVKLDSFLFDDGWDDTSDLWKVRADFKDGFKPLTEAAAAYGAAPGIWLSPWGGYSAAKQKRLATARRDGYEIVNDGLALSGPKYYKLFHDAVTRMVTEDGVNQFKFDGTGNAEQVVAGSAFSNDFDAAIHLVGDLRQLKPDIFINLTTGTWPSPFWLFYADSIWRGGEDTGFAGVGSDREQWITYRDGETYAHIVEGGRLFPLNSLMLHGIVYGRKLKRLSTDPGHDFANEVHSYFASGTQLQELYITPDLLSAADWDTLAEAAKWARANAETLKDTHWVGGDPMKGEVYGWAAWSKDAAILTLRNPSDQGRTLDLDIGETLELPAGAAQRYLARSVWEADGGKAARVLVAGRATSFHLEPFEVLTLEGVPQR
jgi:hypothetical protein